MFDFQPLNDIRCQLGEGPIFDQDRNTVWYVDIVGRSIHGTDLGSAATRSFIFESEVGSIGLCKSGRLVVALRSAVGFFDVDSGGFEQLAEIEADNPATRTNDGKVGPDGAFWVGTMDDEKSGPARRPLGSLYRVTANGQVERKVEGVHVSNGLAFSVDGRTLYHADTTVPTVDAWDLDPDTGAIANRRSIAAPDDTVGRPDGAALDADGNYWSAGISAARLNKIAPDGALLESHEVPVARPTMPCFVGEGLRQMVLTSLRVGLTAELSQRYPQTGITLIGPSPVAGQPVGIFQDVG